jgi:hypothetical protein
MRDLAPPDFVIDHLDLRAFTTIDKKQIPIHRHYLAGWMTIECRNSRIVSENCNGEHESEFTISQFTGFRISDFGLQISDFRIVE